MPYCLNLTAEQQNTKTHFHPQVTDGAGRLIGESVLGVGHGLHSRAPLLLGMALQEDLLQSTDFGSRAEGSQQQGEGAAGVCVRVLCVRVCE